MLCDQHVALNSNSNIPKWSFKWRATQQPEARRSRKNIQYYWIDVWKRRYYCIAWRSTYWQKDRENVFRVKRSRRWRWRQQWCVLLAHSRHWRRWWHNTRTNRESNTHTAVYQCSEPKRQVWRRQRLRSTDMLIEWNTIEWWRVVCALLGQWRSDGVLHLSG